MITADVICDSVSPEGHRLTTFKLRYPRFIHPELLTHRALSRNSSSSRAVPTTKLIEEAANPATRAYPTHWGVNQSGMKAAGELKDIERAQTKAAWDDAAEQAVRVARNMSLMGLHKQAVNRLLEPFTHINVVATATEWSNFFALRRHDDAQPEMQALAEAMWAAYQGSEPQLLQPGEWHLPFVDPGEAELIWPDDHPASSSAAVRISVARCARVSYESHVTGRRSTIEEDLKLYARLVGEQPLHASPAEHQATPDTHTWTGWDHPSQHKNYVGWRQYRAMLPGEAVTS